MKNKTTIELVTLLTAAINEGNQSLINIYAQELTARLFVPGKGYSFDDILEGFGYKEIEKNDRQMSIEEYMEGVENERSRKRN
jgi:hypothetical protein